MRRYLLAVGFLIVTLVAASGVALAQVAPEFKLGFRALADQIPDRVGEPLENEHWGPHGDSLQQTTGGLLVWRKADNWTAFTDGSRTWVSGPYGLQERSNDERFPWESRRPALAASTAAPPSSQLYTPQVKAMDEEAGGAPSAVMADFVRQLDAKWATAWGWRPRKPVTVYLYFDGYRMADGVAAISGVPLLPSRRTEIATTTAGLKTRDMQTGGWAILMNLKKWFGTDLWDIRAKHLFTHEYTHVLQSDVAGVAGPTWFHEGMAEFAAFAEVPEAIPHLDRTKYVTRYRDRGDLPSLRELQEGWREITKARDERAQLAYGMSYLAVRYLANQVGGTSLLRVLESTAAGQDFEAALQTVTGYTLDRLDAEYRQTIPPLP